MLALLLATHDWMIAFTGVLVAVVGFAATGQAARCPRCAGELLSGGAGILGVINLFRLSSGRSIRCPDCDYQTRKADYL